MKPGVWPGSRPKETVPPLIPERAAAGSAPKPPACFTVGLFEPEQAASPTTPLNTRAAVTVAVVNVQLPVKRPVSFRANGTGHHFLAYACSRRRNAKTPALSHADEVLVPRRCELRSD